MGEKSLDKNLRIGGASVQLNCNHKATIMGWGLEEEMLKVDILLEK